MSRYRKRLLNTGNKSSKVPPNDTTLNITSEKWLAAYGLKKLKLDFKQILSSVGFRNCDDYISILKKPVSSRYSDGLFKKVGHNDGMFYNIVASKDGLQNVEARIVQAVDLYKERLEWLTSGSRRSFGVIEEKEICIVCDIQQDTQEDFQFYREIIASVMREQIPTINKFNIARVTPDISKWQPLCISVNNDTINDALNWWSEQPTNTEYSLTSAAETVLDVACDKQAKAIYLFTDGSLLKGAKEIFLEKIKTVTVPVHIVFVKGGNVLPDTESFFQDLTEVTKGRYHVFKLSLKHTQQHHLVNDKGQGVRPDVMLIWEELDKARNTLFDVKSLISDIETGKLQKATAVAEASSPTKRKSKKRSEVYMDSKQWLQVHGLRKFKLTLHTFLKQYVFNHCDGVLNTADNSNLVMVNAQYCKKFAHMTWSDGSIKHVQITEAVYRRFREKILLVLEKYRKRLDWLQNGSRELFGTIVENKVVLMIDTSASMETKLHIVKEKLTQLLKEQLATKDRFNVISFNSKVSLWRENLVPCDLENLENVLLWINALLAQGSTNTFEAMNAAYEMSGVEALYLLSDGRPDQPAALILAQVNENIPVHTISFNCADPEANQFLYEIASKTKGRYHHFSDEHHITSGFPTPYESEDLMLIRQEIEKGLKNIDSMLQLRDECLSKDLQSKEDRGYTFTSRDDLEMYQSRTTNDIRRYRPPTAYTYNQNKASLLRSGVYAPTNPNRHVDLRLSVPELKQCKEKRSKKTDSEIKKWLRNNGISALKLNILDALAPTIVKQKPTYVPALGKEVLSKVYRDVLPIVHTSAGKEFHLVNPQAVDLVSYEGRLQSALENIENKLNDFSRKQLSEDFKSRLEAADICYFELKDDILKDLQDNSTNTILKDVKLLEKEINQGNVYMNQSKDLRSVVRELSKEAKEEREKNDRASSSSPKGKPSNQRETAGKPRNQKFRYHRVLARSDMDGFYYPAIVNKYVNARFVNVLFDDGENQLTCVRYLIPIGGSVPCPTLNVGDYVLVQCYKRNEDVELTTVFYVPGIVQVTPLKMKSITKCYTVIKYNGSKCTALRKDVVKIGRSRFIFSVKFVQALQQQKMSSTQQRPYQSSEWHRSKDERERRLGSSDTSSQASERTEISSHSTLLSHAKRVHVNVSASGGEDIVKQQTRKGTKKRRKSNNEKKSMMEEYTDENRESDSEKSSKSDSDEEDKYGSVRDNTKESNRSSSEEEDEKVEKDTKNDIIENVVNELQKRLEESHFMKMKELEEQKTLLMELHDKLSLNEAKQSAKYEELEKERIHFYKEQQKFLEKQLQSRTDSEPSFKFKDLSEMQMDIFKRQQETQEKLIEQLLDKEKELVQHRNSLKETMTTPNDEKWPTKSLNNSRVSEEEPAKEITKKSNDQSPGNAHGNTFHILEQKTSPYKTHDNPPRMIIKEDTSSSESYDSDSSKEKSDGETAITSNGEPCNKTTENSHDADENYVEEKPDTSTTNLDDYEVPQTVGLEKLHEKPSDRREEERSPENKHLKARHPLEMDQSAEARKVLSVVKQRDEVLARFRDDGWYYRGIVKEVLNDSLFLIEDGIGDFEVPRDDIVTDEDDADNVIQVYDFVIALHPTYLNAYAPGVVMEIENDGSLKVNFHDREVAYVRRSETYLTTPYKFESDCNFIRVREYALIGQAVVCRSDKTGAYHLGMVRDRVAGCRNYLVEWADQTLEIQNYAYIFGAHTKRQEFTAGNHVLAVSNQDTFTYLPGTVVECDENLLHVEFCDSQRLKNVDSMQSFWLPSNYFNMVSQYWKDKNHYVG